MKKIYPILIVGILIISGLGVTALNNENKKQQKIITEKINIDLELENKELYHICQVKPLISK